jgi:hypothetical protein
LNILPELIFIFPVYAVALLYTIITISFFFFSDACILVRAEPGSIHKLAKSHTCIYHITSAGLSGQQWIQ